MSKIDWFLSLIRVASTTNPITNTLLQLHAEIDSYNTKSRIDKLEDPLSNLHPDVIEVSAIIYNTLKSDDSNYLNFSNEFYEKYSRVLSILDTNSYINRQMALGSKYPLGIHLTSSYVIYMCKLFENQNKMQEIFDIVDRCENGLWLDGFQLAESVILPVTVVRHIFSAFASKGYGILSKEIGACKYLSNS